jgi:hypothetical protein
MGCWNGTCVISNLPILAGERVKVVLLHSPYGKASMVGMSAFCYSHGILTPVAWALTGDYNDYGCVENFDEDWNYRLVEMFFKERYKEIEVEGVKMKEFTIPDIIEGIERGSLKALFGGDKKMKDLAERALEAYKDNPEAIEQWKDMAQADVSEKWRKSELSFVMIRQDIWDGLCASEFKGFWNPKKKHKEDEYCVTAKEYCNYQFDNIKKALSKPKDSTDPADRLNRRWAISDSRMFNSGEGSNLLLESYYATALESSDTAYEGFLDDFFKAWCEFTAISSQMSLLRKAWLPQSGAGSQSQEWEAYLYLNKIINEVCINAQKTEEEYE